MTSILYACVVLLLVVAVEGQMPVCGVNEVFQTCGSACTETCDHRPEICIMVCKTGCFCEKGYVRQSNAPGSPCIKREACKRKDDTRLCGAYEEYNTCGSACAETCNSKPSICTDQCVAGCFCSAPGYVRRDGSANSPCIKREQCPK